MNLRPIGFIDTTSFTSYFWTRLKKRLDEDGEIVLRGPDPEIPERIENRPILKDWNSARSLIAKLRNSAAPHFDGKPVTFGNIRIVRTGVNETIDWHSDEGEYAEAYARLLIGLVPSPGAWLYCAGEGLVLQVGSIVLLNHRAPHCEANFGPCVAVRLEADIRRPDAS